MLLASDRLSSTAKQAACHGGSAQRGWLWLKATGIHGEPCDPNPPTARRGEAYRSSLHVRPACGHRFSELTKETKEGSRGAATVVSAWKLYAPWQTQINRAVDS